jgi:protein phosphatase 2C family protein 2/3
MDSKTKPFTNTRGGRIILLGDGTEVLTDSDDTDMFDNGEEDKDLASQVHKGQTTSHESSEPAVSPAALPEKIDVNDPNFKAVAQKVLSSHSDDSTNKPEETKKDT